jgi:hypothetical protein
MNLISKDLAVEELNEYLANFIEGDFNVEKDYPKILKAVCSGNLTFNEDLIPKYKLITALNRDTEFQVDEITFITRILPTMTAKLARGVDLKNDAVRYSLVVTAHIIGFASINELDKLSKRDYELIQELSMVFI